MLGELVELGRSSLARADFGPAPREAHLLLGHVLGLTEAQVLARWDQQIPSEPERRFRSLLERRLRGEPVAYLLGRREFYGRSFRVDSRVLIPRPETEHIVEAALRLPLPPRPRILDLGTGSGCLAVTLALEIDQASVVAVDISPAALSVARLNAVDLIGARALDRIRFVAGDLAGSLSLENFDLVVSNPPYIGRDEEAFLLPEIRDFEPHRALFSPGGDDAMIQRLLAELEGLARGSHLAFEIGHRQSERVTGFLARSGFQSLGMTEDYQGIARVAVARRK
jgi:release factor glutamine methyltransferase